MMTSTPFSVGLHLCGPNRTHPFPTLIGMNLMSLAAGQSGFAIHPSGTVRVAADRSGQGCNGSVCGTIVEGGT
jgi:hypothetical protein